MTDLNFAPAIVFGAIVVIVVVGKLIADYLDSRYPDLPCKFHYHDWVYTLSNNTRRCERCREKQYRHMDSEGSTLWSHEPEPCEYCHGRGRILHNGVTLTCAQCNGKGLMIDE